MSDKSDQRHPSGDLLFAGFFLVIALLLLSQLPWQVQWFPKTGFAAQPAFWPTASLIGMVVFGAAHFATRFRLSDFRREWSEASIWLRSVEFVVWFMIYVHTVPVIGYLASTLIFAPLLAYREGYRRPRTLLIAAVTGFVIVVFFKSFLSVKIPGGMIYEYLPTGLRTFMIINF